MSKQNFKSVQIDIATFYSSFNGTRTWCFQICTSFKFEYLAFHFWVGIWLAIIATIVVAVEGGCLLRYVSRFTQDIFALLISLIFIFESLKKLYMVSAPVFVDSQVLLVQQFKSLEKVMVLSFLLHRFSKSTL